MAASPSQEHFSKVAYGQGRFIAVGQGTMGWGEQDPPILYVCDDNGQTWTAKTVPDGLLSTMRPLCGIATNSQGRWVAAGCGGDYLLSTDNGNSWQVVTLDKYGQFDLAFR